MLDIHDAYLEMQVQTATDEQRLIMLFDGAVKFSRIAMQAIQQKKHDMASRNLCYAQNIVLHLKASLRQEHTPGLSGSLDKLYTHWHLQLVRANQEKTIQPVQEVIEGLTSIRNSFAQVEQSLRSEGGV